MNSCWLTSPYKFRYRFTHPLDEIIRIKCNIKYCFQRITRGWADCDIWNLDEWFLDVMPNMLIYLQEHHMAFPGCDEADTSEKWEQILHHIAWLFNECKEETCDQKNEYYEKLLRGDDDKEFGSLYVKRDKELQEYRNKCKDEAFELFSKWFFALWD